MAELEAYLKSLGLNYAKLTNAGAGVPQPYQGLASATQGGITPIGPPTTLRQVLPTRRINTTLTGLDNPQEESQPVASVNDDAALLERLKLDPLSTGISNLRWIPTIISGFDGMNFLDSVNGYVPPDTDMAVGPQIRRGDGQRADPVLRQGDGRGTAAQHAPERVLRPAGRVSIRSGRDL